MNKMKYLTEDVKIKLYLVEHANFGIQMSLIPIFMEEIKKWELMGLIIIVGILMLLNKYGAILWIKI